MRQGELLQILLIGHSSKQKVVTLIALGRKEAFNGASGADLVARLRPKEILLQLEINC